MTNFSRLFVFMGLLCVSAMPTDWPPTAVLRTFPDAGFLSPRIEYDTSSQLTGVILLPPPPPVMISVIGGTFMMGCTAEQAGCFANEIPVRSVTVADFLIGKYEVTQSEWVSLWGTNPSYFWKCTPNCPVEGVSWYDAVAYCNRLSRQEGYTPCYYSDGGFVQVYAENGMNWSLPNNGPVYWKPDANGYRLPTEAEWEYVARGGGLTMAYRYAGNNSIDAVAWYFNNSTVGYTPNDNGIGTHPVGSKPSNELGLFDLSGNAQEWCYDWYRADYYSGLSECMPTGPSLDTAKIVRGGSYKSTSTFNRISARSFRNPTIRDITRGFRLARTP